MEVPLKNQIDVFFFLVTTENLNIFPIILQFLQNLQLGYLVQRNKNITTL
jgi:hypothetical protein